MFGGSISAQSLVQIEASQTILLLPSQKLSWEVDRTKNGLSLLDDTLAERFEPLASFAREDYQKHWIYRAHFRLENKTGIDQEFILQTPKSGYVRLFISHESGGFEKLETGSLLPLEKRSERSAVNGLKILLRKDERRDCWLHLQPVYSIYLPPDLGLHLQQQNSFEERDRKRLFWQGMFLGIILVMAFYNLFLLFAVRDISYLYYVISFVSLGFYFAFYYGFGIEYIWPHSPLWDTYCYTMLVPLTGLARILFTRTYLHTPQLMPGINRWLNVLILVSSLATLAGLISFLARIDILHTLIAIIGILGSVILVMMLVAGIIAYRKKYEPAKYFIVANILLVIGAIAFISREMGLASDNYFTRYFVQFGVLIQLVVFSLGLASRLNRTRLQLAHETLEKERLALDREREKKELIEQQRTELQQQVAKQTADLKQKNLVLEEAILQLRESQAQLRQLNQVKDKLFSVVSHDLRNPLATMQSFMKLLTEHHDKLSEEEKQQLFAEAQQSLDNLNLLLYNLLQWSRSQMNILQFKPEKLFLKTTIDNCIRVLHLHAHMKKIKINTTIDEHLFALADKEMTEFIIRNLLSNAIKFSQRNSEIMMKAFEKDGNVRIEVIDSGIGMSEARIRKLMEMNAGITRRGTEKEKGTGLGLLISKEFIEKNGGQLDIESEPGKGTVFSFSLPLYTAKVFS